MRKFVRNDDGLTIVDEDHGATVETFVPKHEIEMRRSWLGAMGCDVDAAMADPVPAKARPAKKRAKRKK